MSGREERRERAGGEGPAAPAGDAPRHAGYAGAARADLERLRRPRDVSPDARPRRRRGLALAVLAAAAIAFALWWLAPRAVQVEVAPAVALADVAGEPLPVLSGSGYLVPARPFIAVGSRVPGRIQRYLVEEGDRVRAGDALVELDLKPFQATVDQARAALASARAQRGLADSDLRRTRSLFEQGVTAAEERDRRESEARVAAARVAELAAALERAEADLADAVIRAPTDGVVLQTHKQPGEIAVPGGFSGSGDLLRLADLAELRAELDVNESDLPRVARGQAAEIVPDAFPDARYAGRVVKLAPQIDRQKGTREIEVVVLEPDERLLPDMSVRVIFLRRLGGDGAQAAATGESVVIPRGAIRRDATGRPFAWVVRDGRSERAGIVLGDALGERVIVREGLTDGDRVIVGEAPEDDGARVVEQSQADAAR
jgi:RND family efflux transporter MFP subunit